MKSTIAKKTLVAAAVTAAGAVGLAAIAGGANASTLTDTEDGLDMPIVGDALIAASNVALEFTGAGTVTETEIEDEDSYYEVEVTMPDGKQIDVQLDEEFNVVGSEADDQPEAGDDD